MWTVDSIGGITTSWKLFNLSDKKPIPLTKSTTGGLDYAFYSKYFGTKSICTVNASFQSPPALVKLSRNLPPLSKIIIKPYCLHHKVLHLMHSPKHLPLHIELRTPKQSGPFHCSKNLSSVLCTRHGVHSATQRPSNKDGSFPSAGVGKN